MFYYRADKNYVDAAEVQRVTDLARSERGISDAEFLAYLHEAASRFEKAFGERADKTVSESSPAAVDRAATKSLDGYEAAVAWLQAFEERHGRPLRVLHVGNVAGNAYLNAKFLRAAGAECHVLSYDYYHPIGTPEWEDGVQRPTGSSRARSARSAKYLSALLDERELAARFHWLLLRRARAARQWTFPWHVGQSRTACRLRPASVAPADDVPRALRPLVGLELVPATDRVANHLGPAPSPATARTPTGVGGESRPDSRPPGRSTEDRGRVSARVSRSSRRARRR